MREVYDGTRQYTFSTPFVPGTSAIARIHTLGPDSTSLKPGQVVLVDPLIRGRDDPTKAFLSGLHDGFTEGSKKLMRGEWRDSTYAEYAKVPLESCYILNEQFLLGPRDAGGLGYSAEDLTYITQLMVPFGGLHDIGLQPGETTIIAPATGPFGGAAVQVALAMGRNTSVLATLAKSSNRVTTVEITGNVEADMKSLMSKAPSGIDAFFDISPRPHTTRPTSKAPSYPFPTAAA